MTIQATSTRSRLAEHDGFSCGHEPMVSRVDTNHHLGSHALGVGDPSGTSHAGKPGTCQHCLSPKRVHAQMQAPSRTPITCPTRRLKKRSADIEFSDFRQFSILRVNINAKTRLNGVQSTRACFDGRPGPARGKHGRGAGRLASRGTSRLSSRDRARGRGPVAGREGGA